MINGKQLKDAISFVKKGIDIRKSMFDYDGVFLVFSEGKGGVYVSSSFMSVVYSSFIPCTGVSDRELAIPKFRTTPLYNLPDDDIDIVTGYDFIKFHETRILTQTPPAHRNILKEIDNTSDFRYVSIDRVNALYYLMETKNGRKGVNFNIGVSATAGSVTLTKKQKHSKLDTESVSCECTGDLGRVDAVVGFSPLLCAVEAIAAVGAQSIMIGMSNRPKTTVIVRHGESPNFFCILRREWSLS